MYDTDRQTDIPAHPLDPEELLCDLGALLQPPDCLFMRKRRTGKLKHLQGTTCVCVSFLNAARVLL